MYGVEMRGQARAKRCPVGACIFNTSGACRHALRPEPESCQHRRSVPIVPTERVVKFQSGKSSGFAITLRPSPATA